MTNRGIGGHNVGPYEKARIRHATIDSKVVSSRMREWADWAREKGRQNGSDDPPPAEITPIAMVMARRIWEIDDAIALSEKNQRYVIERLYRDGVSLQILGRWFACRRMALTWRT